MSKVKLRIRPVITAQGIYYFVEKKNFITWSEIRGQCIYVSIPTYFSTPIRFSSVKDAVEWVELTYGQSAEIVEYRP